MARFSGGYDNVDDVAACAQAWILLTITPDSVRRSVAVVVVALALALSRKMLLKDRLTHEG